MAEGAIVFRPLVGYRVGHPSIVNSGDPTVLITNALRSVQRAAVLRPAASAADRSAYLQGARALYLRLAYARLVALDGKGTREALRGLRGVSPAPTPRAAALFLASLLPRGVLRGLGSAKRRLAHG